MMKRTTVLGVVGVGLTAVVVGFALAFVEGGAEWLVEATFGLFGVTVPPEPAPGSFSRADWIVFWSVMAVIGAPLLVFHVRGRLRETRTRRALRRAFRTTQLLGDAYATKGGDYAVVGVKVRTDLWVPGHKLFHEQTLWTTGSVAEPELEYRFIVASLDGDKLTPLPVDQEAASGSPIHVVMGLGGAARSWWLFWRGLHWFLSEAKIPWISPVVGSACVFWLAAIQAPIGERMKAYFHESFWPWWRSGGGRLPAPPRPLRFEAIEAQLSVGQGRPKLEFVEPLHRWRSSRVAERISEFRTVFPLGSFASMKFAAPIADD